MKHFLKKLSSWKLWLTIFCCALLAYIVIGNRVEFLSIAEKLTWVPLAYLPINVLQKKLLQSKEE